MATPTTETDIRASQSYFTPTQTIENINNTTSNATLGSTADIKNSPFSSTSTKTIEDTASTITNTTPTMEDEMRFLPICSLPMEIVENIVSRLKREDVSSMRLVCRDLEAKILHHFGRTYFKTITTDLSAKSLQDLKAISEHKGLKDHVKILCLTEMRPRFPGEGFIWKRQPTGLLVRPNPAVDMLGDILVNGFEKCRSFTVDSYYWRDLDALHPGALLPPDLLGILLEIIMGTSLTVRHLNLSNIDDWLKKGQYHLYRQRCLMPDIFPAWACLQELSLDYGIEGDLADLIADIIPHATGLRKLKLDLRSSGHKECASFIDQLFHAATLPSLQDLELSSFEFSEESQEPFSMLLSRLAHSLRRLSFDLGVAFKYQGTPGYQDYSWQGVFRRLKNEVPLLQTFYAHNLSTESPGDWPGDQINFDALKDDQRLLSHSSKSFQLFESEGHVVGVRYEGPNMSEALDMIADAVSITP